MRAPAVLVAVLLAATLTSCAGGGGARTVPSAEDVDEDLTKAREVEGPLYFAGNSVAGLPLTAVAVQGPGRAVFFYGTCVIPAGQREGGCAVPVQVQNFPFASAQWRRATGCERQERLLGVPTARHDGLVLFTSTSVVKVYARSPAEDREVALALRSLDDASEPVGQLPPPTRSVDELQARVCGT